MMARVYSVLKNPMSTGYGLVKGDVTVPCALIVQIEGDPFDLHDIFVTIYPTNPPFLTRTVKYTAQPSVAGHRKTCYAMDHPFRGGRTRRP